MDKYITIKGVQSGGLNVLKCLIRTYEISLTGLNEEKINKAEPGAFVQGRLEC